MRRAVGFVLALGLTVAACGDDDEGGTGAAGTTSEPESTSGNASSESTETTSAEADAESPLDEIELTLTPVAEAEAPTALVTRPGADALYVAEREGVVRPVRVSGSGADRSYEVGEPLLDTSMLPHGGSWFDPSLFMASLDHAMWFHRTFRADDWLLYEQDSPNATNGRGLSRGLVFTRQGTLVATVMQEGLIRTAR